MMNLKKGMKGNLLNQIVFSIKAECQSKAVMHNKIIEKNQVQQSVGIR